MEWNSQRLVERCRVAFGWRDLSSAVVMDVGCGEEGNCGNAVLEKFTDVGTIISIDNNPRVVHNFKVKTTTKMECVTADIQERDTLRRYLGKVDKVIANNVFHQFKEKEEAFRNVYHLLKPGGEAAISFIRKSLLYDWLMEMLKKPKWKDAYTERYIDNFYNRECGAKEYQKMVEGIGFRVVEYGEEEIVIHFASDQVCKDWFYNSSIGYFNLPSEVLDEFKEDCFRVVLQLSPRDGEGRPCYRATEMCLLLVKPVDGSKSKTKNL